ncbi:hypothetical protein P691DRAFT_759404 [Macrolepiota fuliginosa MF-IS2]|uniref:NACHT domain-containing protein n=1 Tax=Macrolepiota fuliginosa MF-IS2 TaxID=1400762 RepID=A0A9P6C539_9AGAR|nr:hypothetical protein P691DRAFT_759404 [Macrolepiota fuliginosa MF-IS2]
MPFRENSPSTQSQSARRAHRYAPYPDPENQPSRRHPSRAPGHQEQTHQPAAGRNSYYTYADNPNPSYVYMQNQRSGNSQNYGQARRTGGNSQNAVRSSMLSSRSSTQSHSVLPPILAHTHSHRHSPDPVPLSRPPSRQFQNISRPHNGQGHRQGGILEKAHDFVMNNPVLVQNDDPSSFMKDLMEYTIPGAAFDDSDRNPPPRCHPGTRLEILHRSQNFFADPQHSRKMLWIVGPAGVGKSAIMQSLAETVSSVNSDVVLGASLFFSIDGRNEGSKTFTTIAYQIAVKDRPYRDFIRNEMSNDPTLVKKSLRTQFTEFIVGPFALRAAHGTCRRFLILIDGLDECAGTVPQCEILDLISSFCTDYPTAPLVWIVASRPEPHITTFFTGADAALVYEKEEIVIDSDQGREDVEHYLRDRLGKLRSKYIALPSEPTQWPPEHKFLKLSVGAGGLFAFASTAVRFIDDPETGDPESRFQEILEVIDNILSQPRHGDVHPMATLDALYSRIISRVPAHVLSTTKKLLLAMSNDLQFIALCNWLGLASNIAYGALHQLHSVLYIPPRELAHEDSLGHLHKSFQDYLCDFNRSGIFQDHKKRKQELESECVRRILNEAADPGVNGGSGPGIHNILVSWDTNGRCQGVNQNYLYFKATNVVRSRFEVARALALDRMDVHEGPEFYTWTLRGETHHIWGRLDERERESQLSIFVQHFKHQQIHSPDLTVIAYVDIRNWGFLFCEFVDPADAGNWSCCIPYHFPSATGI